jgi:hypothetical protein
LAPKSASDCSLVVPEVDGAFEDSATAWIASSDEFQ